MTELARSQGYSNAQIDGQTIQKLFYDFHHQEIQRTSNTSAKAPVQSPAQVPADISSSVQHESQRIPSPSADAQVQSPTLVSAELSLSVEKPRKKYNARVPRKAKSNSKRNLPSGDETSQPQSRITRCHGLHGHKEGSASASRVSPADQEPRQSNSSDSDQWAKRDRWRIRKYGIGRKLYVLDSGFRAITDVEYDNMPDPTVELTSEQLALLRRGFLTFYEFPKAMILEIATAIGEDKVHEGIIQRNRRTAKISLVSYTLRFHVPNH